MPNSMTGFATRRGQGDGGLEGTQWIWEIRSVNGKGLDLRLRLPEGIDGLEPAVRAAVSAQVQRGNVSLSLKVTRASGADAPRLNAEGLKAALGALAQVQAKAATLGLELGTPSAAEVLALRGVLDQAAPEEDTGPLLAALLADLPPLLDAFNAMRAAEGHALGAILSAQADQIALLTGAARAAAEARRPLAASALRDAVARVLTDGIDEARLAQELALLAVKADVTEEIDRLGAHVSAARDLIAATGPIGRRFDFLMQEFNREANTLCSKSGAPDLTRIGLDLKTVIDQMREQVQNVE